MQTVPDRFEETVAAAIVELQEVGAIFYAKNWSLATSSNYSAVLSCNPLTLLMTASGKDKGKLTPEDFVIVDETGKIVRSAVTDSPTPQRPSAETMLHIAIAKLPGVGAVLHTHSVWSTILSERYFAAGRLSIEGYEMLKGLSGIDTHQTRLNLPIFANSQDIPTLASQVEREISASDHGFLIQKHGLYTWGGSILEAKRHVEVLEFLFEVLVHSGG